MQNLSHPHFTCFYKPLSPSHPSPPQTFSFLHSLNIILSLGLKQYSLHMLLYQCSSQLGLMLYWDYNFVHSYCFFFCLLSF